MRTPLTCLYVLFLIGAAISSQSQPVLSIDFNRRNASEPANTLSGFQSFVINSNLANNAIQTQATVRVFGSISVTLSNSAPNGYDDRLRATPVDSGMFTDGLLLRDFVFSRDLNGNGGLDLIIAGLVPNHNYRVVIWSFDSGSGGARVSDWSANGVSVRENYTFDGRVLPTNNDNYKFNFLSAADATGTLLIQARRDSASVDANNVASFGVFLNALQVTPEGSPPTIIGQPAGGTRGLGDRFTFTVSADGEPPLTYTWFKNGSEVVGGDSNSLTLANLSLADTAAYTVQIQNFNGSITSNPAMLTVSPDPPPDLRQALISYWPLDTVSTDDVGRVSTPDLYSRNDMLLANMSELNQVFGQFSNALNFDGGTQYGYRVSGSPLYANTAFTVSLWINANGIGQADRRFFSESSTNANNPLFNLGTHASGADGTIRVFIRNDSGTVLLNRNSTRTALDGFWHHVVWTETNGQAKLYIDGLLDDTDFTYTRGPLTLDQTSIGAIVRAAVGNWCAGTLDEVALWNRKLTFTEIQSVRTNGVPLPVSALAPVIIRQPAGADVFAGETVALSVDYTGTQPISFQWKLDGANIDDATNSVLLLASIQTNQAGVYSVILANTAGMTISSNAVVTVHPIVDIRSGLIAYWPLDVLSGLTPDATTNGNDLLAFNLDGSNIAPGQFGNAISFNGTDELLARINTNGFGLPIYQYSRYSVALWVKGNAGQMDRRVFSEGSTLNNNQLLNIGTDSAGVSGVVDMFIRNDDGGAPLSHRKSSGVAFDGNWHHIAWVDDNGAGRLYIDGVQDSVNFTYARGTLTPNTASVGGIQRAAPGNWFAGSIDDVALWRRALSTAEVQHIKMYGPNPPPPIHITEISVTADTVRLTFTVPDPNTFYCVQQTASLANPAWSDVPGLTFIGPNGNTFIVEFPRPQDTQHFYRVYNCP
jgi:hypothetical protein